MSEIKEIKKTELANTEIIRKNSKRGEEVVKIEIDKVVIREGFNVRKDYGDIEGLANSILENGQIVPARVDALANGTFVLTDGHRRFEALKLLKEQGHEPMLKAIINGVRTTEEQRIIQMFLTQDNKQLSALEVCELIRRLINLGYDQTEVAKKIGKSESYVSNMLSVSEESPVIKNLVESGRLTVSTVVEAKREIPVESERVARIKKVSEEEEGKISAERITGKKAKKQNLIAEKIITEFELEDTQENRDKILDILSEF